MSQRYQRNDFSGEINNVGGTFVAGAVFNSGGGNIYVGGRPFDSRQNSGHDLLEKGGLCVLSLGNISIYPSKLSS